MDRRAVSRSIRRPITRSTISVWRRGGCNGYAAPLGFLEAGAAEFAGELPLILKLNNHDLLLDERDPEPAVTGSFRDALRLGCAAVGFTIYPGSAARSEMYQQLQEISAEAKEHGLAVVVWSYPRGPVSARKARRPSMSSPMRHRSRRNSGANIIKVKLPSSRLEQPEAKKAYEAARVPWSPSPRACSRRAELLRRAPHPDLLGRTEIGRQGPVRGSDCHSHRWWIRLDYRPQLVSALQTRRNCDAEPHHGHLQGLAERLPRRHDIRAAACLTHSSGAAGGSRVKCWVARG